MRWKIYSAKYDSSKNKKINYKLLYFHNKKKSSPNILIWHLLKDMSNIIDALELVKLNIKFFKNSQDSKKMRESKIIFEKADNSNKFDEI